VGWQSYSATLQQHGLDFQGAAELLRDADVRTMMNVYTQGVIQEKRLARSQVVQMVLG
jgi:hypothetical protein